jgi:hypothetical protein
MGDEPAVGVQAARIHIPGAAADDQHGQRHGDTTRPRPGVGDPELPGRIGSVRVYRGHRYAVSWADIGEWTVVRSAASGWNGFSISTV